MNTKVAVKESANFLDRIAPRWYRHINVERLDLSDPDLCIVGQCFGRNYQHHLRTLRELDAPAYRRLPLGDYSGVRAFALSESDGKWTVPKWKRLTALWREQIQIRRRLDSSSIPSSGPIRIGKSVPAATGIGQRSALPNRIYRRISAMLR